MGPGRQRPEGGTAARVSGWAGRSAGPCDAARKGEKPSWASARVEATQPGKGISRPKAAVGLRAERGRRKNLPFSFSNFFPKQF